MRNIKESAIMATMTQAGAFITDSHFVYASGLHGTAYVNKDALYPDPLIVADLCGLIASHFIESGSEYDIVVGPEKGGIILAQWTAYNSYSNWHPPGRKIFAVYAEKEGEEFVFRRGYDKLIPGKRVLIVEDILTTGGSVAKVVKAVRKLGGEVVGVGALCNRGFVTAEDIGNVPELFALANINLETWEEEDCILCKLKVPINTEFGKGREFLARKQTQNQ